MIWQQLLCLFCPTNENSSKQSKKIVDGWISAFERIRLIKRVFCRHLLALMIYRIYWNYSLENLWSIRYLKISKFTLLYFTITEFRRNLWLFKKKPLMLQWLSDIWGRCGVLMVKNLNWHSKQLVGLFLDMGTNMACVNIFTAFSCSTHLADSFSIHTSQMGS